MISVDGPRDLTLEDAEKRRTSIRCTYIPKHHDNRFWFLVIVHIAVWMYTECRLQATGRLRSLRETCEYKRPAQATDCGASGPPHVPARALTPLEMSPLVRFD